MEKNEDSKRKKVWKILIFLLLLIVLSLLFVGVTYTVGSSFLNFVGIQSTQMVSWDVRISDLTATTVGSAKFKEGEISLTSINNFNVDFNKPGDAVVLTFEVVNKGNLDAKLDYFSFDSLDCYYADGTLAADFCKNIYYSVEYDDGSVIKLGDILNSGQRKKVRATLKYFEDAIPPSNIVNINNLNITFIYGQK